jgi:hypothetical protein
VPAGQLDRLPAALGRLGRRPVDVDHRLVHQAGELEERPPVAARQRDALLQVPVCLLEPGGPDLGATEADQRQRTQVLAEVGRHRLRRVRCCLLPLRLLGHCLGVAALAGVQ